MIPEKSGIRNSCTASSRMVADFSEPAAPPKRRTSAGLCIASHCALVLGSHCWAPFSKRWAWGESWVAPGPQGEVLGVEFVRVGVDDSIFFSNVLGLVHPHPE